MLCGRLKLTELTLSASCPGRGPNSVNHGEILLEYGIHEKLDDTKGTEQSTSIFVWYSLLQKVPDHFIFTVESVGAVQPEDLVVQALDLLEDKCDSFLRELNTAKK